MKLKMFCIRDRQIGFMTPYFLQSEGQARRSFQDEVNRKGEDNMLNRHPEDYELYALGEFESDTGSIVLYDKVLPLCAGSSMVVPEAQMRLKGVN